MHVVKGRCADIDHELRLLFDQHIHGVNAIERILVQIPDVFANSYGELAPLEVNYLPIISWFEIAVLVEDIVVGQERFMYNALYFLLI